MASKLVQQAFTAESRGRVVEQYVTVCDQARLNVEARPRMKVPRATVELQQSFDRPAEHRKAS